MSGGNLAYARGVVAKNSEVLPVIAAVVVAVTGCAIATLKSATQVGWTKQNQHPELEQTQSPKWIKNSGLKK